jgi:hypothetical protein
LIGSFWDQSWFDRLCLVLEGCNCQIDWFGNNHSPWVRFPPDSLRRAGIVARGIVPEDQLAIELAKYPFVLVPAGALDGTETNTGVARLSLPGRILFTVAASSSPVLVVGSPDTCGARFVTHFGIGEVAPYDAVQISRAMDRLTKPENQGMLRQRAATLAPKLSDAGLGEWLARSIMLSTPADSRFEGLFEGYDGALNLPQTGAQIGH